MGLYEIRLELARDPDHPEGSGAYGYEFVAPLDATGHIDPEAWRARRGECTVRRFGHGAADDLGRLVRARSGTWAFHYEAEAEAEADEPGYRFDSHVFRLGEYVSIRERDGELRTFRVARVRALA